MRSSITEGILGVDKAMDRFLVGAIQTKRMQRVRRHCNANHVSDPKYFLLPAHASAHAHVLTKVSEHQFWFSLGCTAPARSSISFGIGTSCRFGIGTTYLVRGANTNPNPCTVLYHDNPPRTFPASSQGYASRCQKRFKFGYFGYS